METLEYTLGNYRIICPTGYYYQDVNENYILDVYRTDELLKENDLVLDLGASIGDFSVLASKKIGKNGQVIAIEPDIESYGILRTNIEINSCQNIIPLNVGVGGEPGEKEITFRDRTYRFKVRPVESILNELHINRGINFIKMDIEGFEGEVVCKSLQTIKKANVISVEIHRTKEKLDRALLPNGFFFRPLTMNYIYKKLVKHLFLHPSEFYKTINYTIKDKPHILLNSITGFDITKNEDILIGSYIKGR